MLQAYYEQDMTDTAVFELFVRRLPAGRDFLVLAGLEQALAFAESLRLREEELDWIERCGLFGAGFAQRLAERLPAFPYAAEISPSLRALSDEVDRAT
jgi:nicotinate phosphoribosyltransferase